MEKSSEERFKTNCIDFINHVSFDIDDLELRRNIDKIILYIEALRPDFLIQNYITKTFKFWKEIARENLDFFIKNMKEIFVGFSPQLITKFEIAVRGIIDRDGEMLEDIWAYMKSLIKICIKYTREKKFKIVEFDVENFVHTTPQIFSQ